MIFIISLGAWLFARHRQPVKQSAETQTTASESKEQTKELDPITIEAIRNRTYASSPIATTQQLGSQGGYSNAVISYQSDSNTIYALQSTPNSSAPAGGWPVIIFDHGYINPATYQTNGNEYRQIIAAFTQAGYMVIKPDYRGHGKSSGSPEGGHFSPVYAYDNLNLVASLKNYSSVNPGRIGLFGHSLGGHVALRTIVASKDIKATVIMAGVVGSIHDLLYNWPNSPMPGDEPKALVAGKKQELIDKYGDPKANPTFWNSVSAINYVDAVTGKVQLHHSSGDSTVPYTFSNNLAAALQKANKSVENYTYPGNDHQFSQNRSLLLQRAVAFYKASL